VAIIIHWLGMHSVLILVAMVAVAATPFASTIDEAFTFAQNGQWTSAASALDRAYAEDPSSFEANNLHYWRGRVAENEKDWTRALAEFEKVASGNPLRALAAWHAALASIQLRQPARASELAVEFPSDFPADMKMQLAREAPPDVALKIYTGLTSREARFQRARLVQDHSALWTLLRDSNTDDVALEAARILQPTASSPRETIDVANALAAHREFDQAVVLYRRAAETPSFKAESLFQIGRAFFQRQEYAAALEQYQAVERLDESDWQKDARYQIASCYWRTANYRAAEKAYLDYVARYARTGVDEPAVRNLVDVYRALGENSKAIALLDQTLAKRLSTAGRQSLLFTKAKILYIEKRYSSALQIFRQLGQMRMRSTPGGASIDEVRYFEAMTLASLGNKTAANAIWKQLASDPLTYYGQKAASRLGAAIDPTASSRSCDMPADPVRSEVANRLLSLRHPVRSETDPAADALGDLVFMGLWDEASRWIERTRRPNARLAADLAYLANRYDHAIAQADRLPSSEPNKEIIYPSAFRTTICGAAAAYHADPLWLHAIIWQESKYNPNAASAASAHGLMQFIPETARTVGAAIGIPQVTVDRLYDPETSIRMGAYYWASLMAEFKQPELALAAYNGGPVNVRRWLDKWPGADIEFFVSDIGFVETKRYVQAVFAARAAYGRLP
jgi:soluble lytic murein transglycosylase